jgi:hypothetical protein
VIEYQQHENDRKTIKAKCICDRNVNNIMTVLGYVTKVHTILNKNLNELYSRPVNSDMLSTSCCRTAVNAIHKILSGFADNKYTFFLKNKLIVIKLTNVFASSAQYVQFVIDCNNDDLDQQTSLIKVSKKFFEKRIITFNDLCFNLSRYKLNSNDIIIKL